MLLFLFLVIAVLLSSTSSNAFRIDVVRNKNGGILKQLQYSFIALSSSINDSNNGGIIISDGELISETFQSRYKNKLPQWLLNKCVECGWIYPTRIQEKVLDAILLSDNNNNNNKVIDAIVQAETGSGKTLAYLLPCLSIIDSNRSAIQAIIVVPTRELGLQVSKVARRLASATTITETDQEEDNNNSNTKKKIMIMNVLQGSQNRRQRAWAWAEPPHIVIGTPKELCNMIQYGGIKRYNTIKYLVVDEVDACLLNNQGNMIMSLSSSSSTPLHQLLSKYLSPTYDDGKNDIILDDSITTTLTNNNKNSNNKRPILHKRQTIFCSATIPQHRHFLKQCIQNQWMVNVPPKHICLRPGEQLVPIQIQHTYIVSANMESKFIILRKFIKKLLMMIATTNNSNDGGNNDNKIVSSKKILIFAENHRPLEEMAKVLANDNNGIYWHEQQQQPQQQKSLTSSPNNLETIVSVLRYEDSLSQRAVSLDAFRQGDNDNNDNNSSNNNTRLRILLSTDLAARGLDIVDITHIINFDLPDSADMYVHRAGRSGRFGRSGHVISVVTKEQEFVLQRIINKLQVDVKCIGRQSTGSSNRQKQR